MNEKLKWKWNKSETVTAATGTTFNVFIYRSKRNAMIRNYKIPRNRINNTKSGKLFYRYKRMHWINNGNIENHHSSAFNKVIIFQLFLFTLCIWKPKPRRHFKMDSCKRWSNQSINNYLLQTDIMWWNAGIRWWMQNKKRGNQIENIEVWMIKSTFQRHTLFEAPFFTTAFTVE